MVAQRAILKSVPDHLLDGLPQVDQDAIRDALGKPVTIVPEGDKTCPSEQEEVEFCVGDVTHTIWVNADDLIKIGSRTRWPGN
jgi:hypothetical protein